MDPKKPSIHSYYFQSWYSPIFLRNSDYALDDDNSVCVTFDVRREGLPEDEKRERKSKVGKGFAMLANVFKPRMLDSHDTLVHVANL